MSTTIYCASSSDALPSVMNTPLAINGTSKISSEYLLFDSKRLERVFTQCFGSKFNTVLLGGFEEPFYRPSEESGEQAQIYYRADYFASALHEIAHWCIAGEARRQSPDYGYWYSPEGRDSEQQKAFESAEAKPQALEWCFSMACVYNFKISPDNLDMKTGEIRDSSRFKQSILERARYWQSNGLPARGEQYFAALAREFNTPDSAGQPLKLSAVELDPGDLVG